ncbi:MAG: hypothetical protein ACREO5_11260 [Candidatus Binatia bacterium]
MRNPNDAFRGSDADVLARTVEVLHQCFSRFSKIGLKAVRSVVKGFTKKVWSMDARQYGATEGSRSSSGTFSHFDQIFGGRTILRAATPSRLTRASTEPVLRYEYQTEIRTLDDYLGRNPNTCPRQK